MKVKIDKTELITAGNEVKVNQTSVTDLCR